MMMNYEEWKQFVVDHINWAVLPSPPDSRDYGLNVLSAGFVDTTKRTVLPKPPFILNQLTNPYCAAASAVGFLNAHFARLGILPPGGLSMGYLYWRAKELDGIPNVPGTYWRIILKILVHEGVCSERLCPTTDKKPVFTDEMRAEAAKFKIKAYALLNGLEEIKQALASGKYVGVGTIVTSTNWYQDAADDGFLQLPEGVIVGGHATWQYGFDPSLAHDTFKGYMLGVNSWGPEWGDKGYLYMPFDYINWRDLDFGNMVAFQEAWAIEFFEPVPVTQESIIEMQVGKKEAIVDGQQVILDQEPYINPQTKRTLVPLRFVAEQMGAEVEWDAKTQKIRINLRG